MIYCVGKSVFDDILSDSNVASIDCLMKFLLKIIRGKYNYVATDYADFLKISSKLIAKSKKTKKGDTERVIRYLESKYTMDFSLISKIHPKVNVIVGENPSMIFIQKSNTKIDNTSDILLTFKDLNIPLRLEEAVSLISENIEDDKLYYSIANCFFKKMLGKYSSSISIELKYGNGGGTSIRNVVLSSIKHNKQSVLSIVDSDYHCPTGQLSKTAKGIQNTRIWPICPKNYHSCFFCYTLPVIEKENLLLPSEYLNPEYLLSKEKHTSTEIDTLNNLKKCENEQSKNCNYFFLDYYDYKKGFSKLDDDAIQFFDELLNNHPELKNPALLPHISSRIDCNKVAWTVNNRLFKIRNTIANLLIAWGFSGKPYDLI
ncbi:hypothetical protein KZR06_15405 (plasmid) [Lacticaseibacillus paracasei]|uniref:hypothetical protein n=1 Tax=Lacticaseibacillus paracasei TaxID=1597 RepID=UPI0021A889FA|nr:hypothetical protein [Lacticaseibacillus paracasei]UWP78210.1 hypothetical protein KZR06_15405 [Lacticaseibacillus paracasei]